MYCDVIVRYYYLSELCLKDVFSSSFSKQSQQQTQTAQQPQEREPEEDQQNAAPVVQEPASRTILGYSS